MQSIIHSLIYSLISLLTDLWMIYLVKEAQ